MSTIAWLQPRVRDDRWANTQPALRPEYGAKDDTTRASSQDVRNTTLTQTAFSNRTIPTANQLPSSLKVTSK